MRSGRDGRAVSQHLRQQWRKTAMPTSWRPVVDSDHAHDYEAVILSQQSNRQRTFEVYTYGVMLGNRPTLDQAKALVEEIYGPLPWRKVSVDPIEVSHYYFGPTSEFTDPTTLYVVDRLPRLATTAAYGPDLIARGLHVYVGIDAHDEMVPALLAGTVSARDILALMDADVGVWWGVMSTFGDIEDFEDYAYSDDELAKTYEDLDGGEVAIVLVGKRPMRNGQPWDPEIHNPSEAGGLMGNSYLQAGERVELVEVRYNAGHGWRSAPGAAGLSVTA